MLKKLLFQGAITQDEFDKLERNLKTKTEWIPVTERLPEFNENVLVYSAHTGLICIDANIQFDRNVTHWMPLPEPPKGD